MDQPEGIYSADLRPSSGSAHDLLRRHAGDRDLAEAYRVACAEVAAKRRQVVAELGLMLSTDLPGRWVLFRASCADYCQLALEARFIDEADAPGWDVWTATGDALGDDPVLACW